MRQKSEATGWILSPILLWIRFLPCMMWLYADDGGLPVTWLLGVLPLICQCAVFIPPWQDFNVRVSAPGRAFALQTPSASTAALAGAGVTPTVLQCTTVRQEGPLPCEGTIIPLFNSAVSIFLITLGFVGGPQIALCSCFSNVKRTPVLRQHFNVQACVDNVGIKIAEYPVSVALNVILELQTLLLQCMEMPSDQHCLLTIFITYLDIEVCLLMLP